MRRCYGEDRSADMARTGTGAWNPSVVFGTSDERGKGIANRDGHV